MKTSKTTLSFVALALASSVLCGRVDADNPFLRGDTNQDSRVDLSDAQTLLSFLFIGKGDVVLACKDAADANDDGALDITDSVRILDYLFIGQAAPPAPGPSEDAGRDHWGNLCPIVFHGGELPTGQVIGRSDRLSAVPATAPIDLGSVAATIPFTLMDPAALPEQDLPDELKRWLIGIQPIPELV